MLLARVFCSSCSQQAPCRQPPACRSGLRRSVLFVPQAGRSGVIAMAHTESYSLWLMPKGPLAERLQSEIDALAARVPDAPRFAPHVTMLGGVEKPLDEVLEVAEELAGELQPYHITFDRVSFGRIFHQCVYILCNHDPATMAAGAAARKAYGLDPQSNYMPHLSLLYSDIPLPERESLAEGLQAELLQGSNSLGETGFEVGSIAVWFTPVEDKSLKSWQLVKEIPLSQS